MMQVRGDLTRSKFAAIAACAGGFILLVWFLLTVLGLVPPLFLPSPQLVFSTFLSLATTSSFLEDVIVSVLRVFGGFLLAAVLAFPLGVAMGAFKPVEAAFAPIMGFIRYLPVPAFIPLCILWLGLGEREKVSIIFIGTFFQMILMIMDKVTAVPEEYIEIGRTCGLSPVSIVYRIMVPTILPAVLDDFRICVGWAWSYLVVAEIVAASSGIGFFIMESQRYLKTAHVMAGMLVIGILGVTFDLGFKRLNRALFPWMHAA